jgi:hypothetical protein
MPEQELLQPFMAFAAEEKKGTLPLTVVCPAELCPSPWCSDAPGRWCCVVAGEFSGHIEETPWLRSAVKDSIQTPAWSVARRFALFSFLWISLGAHCLPVCVCMRRDAIKGNVDQLLKVPLSCHRLI